MLRFGCIPAAMATWDAYTERRVESALELSALLDPALNRLGVKRLLKDNLALVFGNTPFVV